MLKKIFFDQKSQLTKGCNCFYFRYFVADDFLQEYETVISINIFSKKGLGFIPKILTA